MNAKLSDFLNRIAVVRNSSLKMTGIIMFVLGLLMVIPMLVAWDYSEDPILFAYPSIFCLIVGAVLFLVCRPSDRMSSVRGIGLMFLAWMILFLIGAFPFIMSGMNILDSFFESVSGMTTTGCSVIEDIEELPLSLIVWRSLTQWIGGLFVILLFLFLLPMMGLGRQLFLNELAGSGTSDYAMKMRNAAISFISIYVMFTIINYGLLVLAGMGLGEGFCLALTTISTGGVYCSNVSLTEVSVPVQLITIVFMFLGGVNFYLHFKRLIARDKTKYLDNSEFKLMSFWLIAVTAIIFVMTINNNPLTYDFELEDYLYLFKDSLFTVVSLGTSTGFYTLDYDLFDSQIVFILMLIAFIGASSGSTSGGIKFGRIVLILKYLGNALQKYVHPNGVFSVKIDGKPVDDTAVSSAIAICIMYVFTLVMSVLILIMLGIDSTDAIGMGISTLANLGSGFGSFGPTESLQMLDPVVKIFLMILMLVGRLEIMAALVVFTPGFWKEVWLGSIRRRKSHSQ